LIALKLWEGAGARQDVDVLVARKRPPTVVLKELIMSHCLFGFNSYVLNHAR